MKTSTPSRKPVVIDPSRSPHQLPPPPRPTTPRRRPHPSETRDHSVRVSALLPSPPTRDNPPSASSSMSSRYGAPPSYESPLVPLGNQQLASSGVNAIQSQVQRLHPHQLREALDIGGGRHSSYRSEVSSLTPSEAEMLNDSGLINNGLERGYGTDMSSIPSLPDPERFSNVPTIFDVAPTMGPISNVAGSKLAPHTSAPNDSGPYHNADAGESQATCPHGFRSLGPAPIFSKTATAAIGPPSSGKSGENKTIDLNAIDMAEAEEVEQRHYEGCMLCSPLPSPRLSEESDSRGGPLFAPSDQRAGPPPSVPLPSLGSGDRPTSPIQPTSINPLKPYLELEGEVGRLVTESRAPISDATSRLAVRNPVYFPSHLEATERSFLPETMYRQPVHGDSLSTLMEVDEESTRTHSRHPSHLGLSRPSGETGKYRMPSRDEERPNTTGESSDYSKNELYGNQSERDLLESGDSHLDDVTPLAIEYSSEKLKKKPFSHVLSGGHLSPIHERRLSSGSRRRSWKGAFGRDASGAMESETSEYGRPSISTNSSFGHKKLESSNSIPHGVDPHPGERRDRPGVDGAYEMVDLGGPAQNNQGMEHQKSAVGLLGQMKKHWRRWSRERWCLAGTAGLCILVLIVVLFVVLSVWPRIAQKAVDNAGIEVSSVSIADVAPDSLGMDLSARLANNSRVKAMIPRHAILTFNAATGVSKRDEISSTEKETLDPAFLVSNTSVALYPIDNDGRYRIDDVPTWSLVFKQILFGTHGVNLTLEGIINVHSAGLYANCHINQPVVLPGFGAFDVASSRIQIGDKGTILGELQWNSGAPFYLELGDVDFDVGVGDIVVGTATIAKLGVRPGNNTLVFNGTLDAGQLANDAGLLGKFLSSLYTNSGSPSNDRKLQLMGKNATVNKKQIDWLLPAVTSLRLPVPAMTQSQVDKEIQTFQLTGDLMLGSDKIQIENGTITTSLSLPFESSGLGPATIDTISYNFNISAPGSNEFTVIDIPPASVIVQGHDDASTTFSEANITLVKSNEGDRGLLMRIMQEATVEVSVGGTATLGAETRLGNATLMDYGLSNIAWTLNGFGNFSSAAATLLEIQLVKGTGDSLVWNAQLKMNSSCDLGVNFGPTNLALLSGDGQPIGTVFVQNFILQPGSNDLAAIVTLDNNATSQKDTGDFITAIMSGAELTTPILKVLNGSTSAMPLFEGITFGASIQGNGFMNFLPAITFILVHATDGTLVLESDLKIMNPFPETFVVQTLALSYSDPDGNLIGTIQGDSAVNPMPPGGSVDVHYSPITLPNGLTLTQFRKKFDDAGGVLAIKVAGTVGLSIGGYATEIQVDFARDVLFKVDPAAKVPPQGMWA